MMTKGQERKLKSDLKSARTRATKLRRFLKAALSLVDEGIANGLRSKREPWRLAILRGKKKTLEREVKKSLASRKDW